MPRQSRLRRTGLAAALLGSLLPAFVSAAPSTRSASDVTGYVTVSGQKFELSGEEFTVVG
jgi:hypothetical protein